MLFEQCIAGTDYHEVLQQQIGNTSDETFVSILLKEWEILFGRWNHYLPYLFPLPFYQHTIQEVNLNFENIDLFVKEIESKEQHFIDQKYHLLFDKVMKQLKQIKGTYNILQEKELA